MFRDFSAKPYPMFRDFFFEKKVTHFSGTPPYTLLGEYPPPPLPGYKTTAKIIKAFLSTIIHFLIWTQRVFAPLYSRKCDKRCHNRIPGNHVKRGSNKRSERALRPWDLILCVFHRLSEFRLIQLLTSRRKKHYYIWVMKTASILVLVHCVNSVVRTYQNLVKTDWKITAGNFRVYIQ